MVPVRRYMNLVHNFHLRLLDYIYYNLPNTLSSCKWLFTTGLHLVLARESSFQISLLKICTQLCYYHALTCPVHLMYMPHLD